MYGYHPKEEFAIEVGRSLQRSGLRDNVTIAQYSGKPDNPDRGYGFGIDPKWFPMPRFPNLKRFIRSYYPLDYVVDIHNSLPTDNLPNTPFVDIDLTSRRQIDDQIKKAIIDYCLNASFPIAWHFIPRATYGLKEVDSVTVESNMVGPVPLRRIL